MINYLRVVSHLEQLPAGAAIVADHEALAHYLSDFALRFVPGAVPSESLPAGQPDFWLFLPFATASDFPHCSSEQILQLSLASTCMIVYNLLFDSVVDDPGQPDIATQALAEAALATMHEHLYYLFPAGSQFWDYYHPLFKRFLAAIVEERADHKGRPQPYNYTDYNRLARDKMSMVLINPIGQAILNGTPESILDLIAAWDEINVAVVMLDDIKDWEEDYQQRNYTYLLVQALQIDHVDQPLPAGEALVTQVVFSGVMEELYRQGATHLERAAELARGANAPALAGLAEERANMFRNFGLQLLQRKLAGLRNHLSGQSTTSLER